VRGWEQEKIHKVAREVEDWEKRKLDEWRKDQKEPILQLLSERGGTSETLATLGKAEKAWELGKYRRK